MLGIAAKRSHGLTAGLTLAGLAAAFVSILAAAPLAPRQVTSLLLVDQIRVVLPGPDHRLRRGCGGAVLPILRESRRAHARSCIFCCFSRL